MAKKMELLSANYTELQLVAAAAYSAGDVVTQGDVYGFPLVDVEIGDTFALIVKAEKVRVEKATGTAWTTGDSVTWDAADGNFNLDDTGNPIFGVVYEAAASADAEGIIEFDGYAAHLKA